MNEEEEEEGRRAAACPPRARFSKPTRFSKPGK